MKWFLSLFATVLLIIITQKTGAQAGVSVSFQTFYDNLSPYGQWVEEPKYGYVWVPNEGTDFRPYHTGGHWVVTDYGNTWVSDYPWGWAPYHYGRWTYDPYYGWVWVPGYEWAPAWVSWRYGDGYCGWAPLSPGISIGVSTYACPNDWWVFVGPQYLYRRDFYHYWGGPRTNAAIITRTSFINNTYVDNGTHVRYNYGPRTQEIERVTHEHVPVYKLSGAQSPGVAAVHGSAVNIYRPTVKQTTGVRPTNNVMKAPRPIGGPAPATASRAPEFHSVMQQRQVQEKNGAVTNNVHNPQMPGNRQAAAPNNSNRPQGRPEVLQQRPSAPTPSRQPQGRPEVPQQRPSAPAPSRQPQGRPEMPQRSPAPMPMNRPQQQGRPEMPQQRPSAPMPMNRPEARPEMPHSEPHQAAPPPREERR